MRRFALVTLLTASILEAQQIKVVTLPPADATLQEEFTGVTSVREISDGRLIITDPRDKGLVVADFRTGKVEAIGRKGQGPGEYGVASPLHALRGDSSLMTDSPNGRWLVLSGARIVTILPPDTPIIKATAGFITGADTLGFVLTATRMNPNPGTTAIGKRDSTILVRLSRIDAHGDTIGAIRPRPATLNTAYDRSGKITSLSIRANPLSIGEAAVLTRDGWLAVVRLEPYRVDWRAPNGRWVLGAALPSPLIKMTDREKQAWLDRRASVTGKQPQPPEAISDWPATLPPFASGANSVLPSPNGRLLVMHEKSADHPETVYDVVDRHAVLLGQISMPANERIVGFGARSVYVVVRDDDGIERLARHPRAVDHPILP